MAIDLLKNTQNASSLLTNSISYQQNKVFPLLLLAWFEFTYNFVEVKTIMFNQQLINN